MIIRRLSITVLVALAVVPGCGLAMRPRQTESIWVIGTVSRTYKFPSHRVAFATLETMRSELVESDFTKEKSITMRPYESPDGLVIREGDAELPATFPAFFNDSNFADTGSRPRRQPMLLESCQFEGQTKDKQKVVVDLRRRPNSTQLTVHVGDRGNPVVSDVLLNKVAEILEHPTYLAGSREEGEALRLFFAGVDARRNLPSLDKPDAPELDEDERRDRDKQRLQAQAKKKKQAS